MAARHLQQPKQPQLGASTINQPCTHTMEAPPPHTHTTHTLPRSHTTTKTDTKRRSRSMLDSWGASNHSDRGRIPCTASTARSPRTADRLSGPDVTTGSACSIVSLQCDDRVPPRSLVTSHHRVPASSTVARLMDSLLLRSPLNRVPLRNHWYAGAGLPTAATRPVCSHQQEKNEKKSSSPYLSQRIIIIVILSFIISSSSSSNNSSSNNSSKQNQQQQAKTAAATAAATSLGRSTKTIT